MNVIILSPRDNVAVALRELKSGEAVSVGGAIIEAAEKIPYTHKIALVDIPAGEAVIKYGEVIARTSTDIKKGAWVHLHNLRTDSLEGD